MAHNPLIGSSNGDNSEDTNNLVIGVMFNFLWTFLALITLLSHFFLTRQVMYPDAERYFS